MASKKMVLVVAALLLVALVLEAAPPAAAADCKLGCAQAKAVAGINMEDCLKNCAKIAAEKRDPNDVYLDNKLDIP